MILAAVLVPWHPVPGGMPPAVAPGELFTPAELARAESYARWARAWSWTALAVSLAVACWLGFTSAGRRMTARLPGPWPVRVLLAVAACQGAGLVVILPLRIAGRVHARRAGISVQTWTGFARDVVVGWAVGVAAVALLLVVLMALARQFPRRWPAIGAPIAAALVVAGSFVHPVLVEPLFGRFAPLDDDRLQASILRLGEEIGVGVDQVLVTDASTRTTSLNAYVSGFGSSHRVVLFDTTLDRLTGPQIEAIVAHELAHSRHRDVLIGTVLGALGAAAGVGVLAVLLGPGGPGRQGRSTGQGQRRRRLSGLAEVSAVPTVLAWVAIGTLLAAPVQNGISRRLETRADVTALVATRDPDTFVRMQRELALASLADPTPPPVAQWLFGSHPTVLERVAIARTR